MKDVHTQQLAVMRESQRTLAERIADERVMLMQDMNHHRNTPWGYMWHDHQLVHKLESVPVDTVAREHIPVEVV